MSLHYPSPKRNLIYDAPDDLKMYFENSRTQRNLIKLAPKQQQAAMHTAAAFTGIRRRHKNNHEPTDVDGRFSGYQ